MECPSIKTDNYLLKCDLQQSVHLHGSKRPESLQTFPFMPNVCISYEPEGT